MIEKIRREIKQEYFDYQTLIYTLRDYSYPRDKITNLLKKKYIIRVKKGLYIFGEDYRHNPFSKELLANLIYGPSYISFELALSYHSLIPERVEITTSASIKRANDFNTPVGIFSYKQIPISGFYIGLERIEVNNIYSFLMATPEKAISDMIYTERNLGSISQKNMYKYLMENLRIDRKALERMNVELLYEISVKYKSRKIENFYKLIKNLRGRRLYE